MNDSFTLNVLLRDSDHVNTVPKNHVYLIEQLKQAKKPHNSDVFFGIEKHSPLNLNTECWYYNYKQKSHAKFYMRCKRLVPCI